MEMNFKIADSVTFGFSVGGGSKPAASDGVYGYPIIIPGSLGTFYICGDTPIGYVEVETEG